MKVSIVVTILNEASNIQKLVIALLQQTKEAYEIIIVDGGSTDNTLSVIKNYKFKIKNSKLRLFTRLGNRSVGRNYGIKKAMSDIIAVTDAGGYPKRDWLEKITKPFYDEKVQVVSGYYQSLARTSFEKSITPYFLIMPDKVSLCQEFLPSSRSIAFRKAVWEKVRGYPEQFWHNEDLVFDYNIKINGFKFYFVPEAIVYWQPPRNLRRAAKQLYRFSLGDAESGIKRPKIKYIIFRYIVGLLVLILQLYFVLILFSVFYSLFSILKNYRYARSIGGLFWLPVIQVISDLAVMSGYICGMIKLYANSNSFNKKRRKKY